MSVVSLLQPSCVHICAQTSGYSSVWTLIKWPCRKPLFIEPLSKLTKGSIQHPCARKLPSVMTSLRRLILYPGFLWLYIVFRESQTKGNRCACPEGWEQSPSPLGQYFLNFHREKMERRENRKLQPTLLREGGNRRGSPYSHALPLEAEKQNARRLFTRLHFQLVGAAGHNDCSEILHHRP